ncbi:MAG TPA: hypothetical protein VKY74_20590 [Chloroflexia bacterium]|nr:hypothetical protein [Chloroflexia bacterium]
MTERHPHAAPAHTRTPPAPQRAPDGPTRPGAAETDAARVPDLAQGDGAARLATPRLDGRGNSPMRAAAALQLQRQLGNHVASRMLQRRAAPAPESAAPPASTLGWGGGGGQAGALLTDPRLAGREARPVGPGAARQLQRMIGVAAAGVVLQGVAGPGGLALQRKMGDLPAYSGSTGRAGSPLRRLVDQVTAYNDLALTDTNYDRQLTLLKAIDGLIGQCSEAKDYVTELGAALTPELLHVQNRQASPPRLGAGPPPLPVDFKASGGSSGSGGGSPSSVSSVASVSSPAPTPPARRLPPPLPSVVPTGDPLVSAPLSLPRPPPGRGGMSGPQGPLGGSGPPLGPPRAPARPLSGAGPAESKHKPVVTSASGPSGDLARPVAYEDKGPVRMFASLGSGGGTDIQKAFYQIAERLQSGGYAETIGEEQQIAVSTLISKLAPDVGTWDVVAPSAGDQIALRKLIAAVEGGNNSAVNSALAGLGIAITPAEAEEEAVPATPPDSGVAPTGDAYQQRQEATLARLNEAIKDEVKQHGAVNAVERADREVLIERVEAKAKTAVKTGVGVALGFVPVPGVSQVYSLALAVNQVRSTLGHIRNLKKIRRDMLASGKSVTDLNYIIGKKNQRAIRSGVGGVPIVGSAKSAALKLKGFYKLARGTRGVHRQEIAGRLRVSANQGDVDAQRIILELVGEDQYKAALLGRNGAALITAKMAST